MSGARENHGLDTVVRVCFYEQDFYVLSNFSSFQVQNYAGNFATSEHLYHWHRFQMDDCSEACEAVPTWRRVVARELAALVKDAPSAHEAFRIAQESKTFQRPDWDDVKVETMRRILRKKASQHEYVLRKLLATGDRELVENSWRDDFWGWGPNRDGSNMLGKLWMEIREEIRADQAANRK